MLVKYDKSNLEDNLSCLINNEIISAYHYTEYEGYTVFNKVDSIQEIPFLGLLLESANGNSFSVIGYDYSPNYDIEGLKFNLPSHPFNPPDRFNQINEHGWKRYKQAKVVSINIIERVQKYLNDEFIVPSGVCLHFENNESLYIMNIYIEDYMPLEGKYNFIYGQSLVLFFTKVEFDKYNFSHDSCPTN